ncbi:MAG: thymidylate synthase [Bacillota bacterium]
MKYKLIQEDTFPKVWEKALRTCWEEGIKIKTSLEKEDDPPSKDITAMLVVTTPEKEPKYHRAAFPMGIKDLLNYIDDFITGKNKDLVKEIGYTYYDRIRNYSDQLNNSGIDQLDYVVKTLEETPTAKRAQVTVWNPKLDINTEKEAPDLQRLWFRVVEGRLNMNVHMCSNDLFKATFANMLAFFEMQKQVANELNIPVGNYCHIVDSLHINGSYSEEVKSAIKTLSNRSWQEKTWTIEDIKNFKNGTTHTSLKNQK